MESKVSKKRIVLFVVIFFLIIFAMSTLFYINIQKHASITVEAVVKYVGEDYIIVIDEEEQEYSLKTENDYNIGDRVSAVLKDIQKDSNPKKGTVVKIDTLSKTVQFSIMDPIEETTTEDNIENNTPEPAHSTTSTSTLTAEDQVISYFEALNQNMENYPNDKSLKTTIKSGFVTMVDFLFYDGQIAGKTFDELSESTKLQVLKLAYIIDGKIETYFPDYKEELSNTGSKIYTNVKSKVLETYLDLSTKVCTNNQDLCQTAKEGLSDLKNNFSLTWSWIKEISGVGLTKLKDWYAVWKDAE